MLIRYLLLSCLLPIHLFSQSNSAEAPLVSGVTRALVVGISDYQSPDIPDLRFAHRDAEAFAAFLRAPAGGSLDSNHLVVLANEQATSGQMTEKLAWLLDESKAGDQAIIYFSGHGDVERKLKSQGGYLLCHDAPARVYMAGGALPMEILQAIIRTMAENNKVRVLLIADIGRSSALAGEPIGGTGITLSNLSRQSANEVILVSCEPGELSLEGEQWGGGRSLFSWQLLEGLYGKADQDNNQRVTLVEIYQHLINTVPADAAPASQHPVAVGDWQVVMSCIDR